MIGTLRTNFKIKQATRTVHCCCLGKNWMCQLNKSRKRFLGQQKSRTKRFWTTVSVWLEFTAQTIYTYGRHYLQGDSFIVLHSFSRSVTGIWNTYFFIFFLKFLEFKTWHTGITLDFYNFLIGWRLKLNTFLNNYFWWN